MRQLLLALTLALALFVLGIMAAFFISQASAQPSPIPVTDTPSILPSTVDVPIEQHPDDSNSLQIARFLFQQTNVALGEVTLTITNPTTRALTGYAWYILAPFDSGTPAWQNAEYSAPEKNIDSLAPGQSIILSFPAPTGVFLGDYSISAWVHQIDPATHQRVHADGQAYKTPLLLRSTNFTIKYVDMLQQADGNALVFVTFAIYNAAAARTDYSYSITISKPEDPAPWQNGLYVAPFRTVHLEPREVETNTARIPVALPQGTYVVKGWLHDSSGALVGYYEFPQPVEQH